MSCSFSLKRLSHTLPLSHTIMSPFFLEVNPVIGNHSAGNFLEVVLKLCIINMVLGDCQKLSPGHIVARLVTSSSYVTIPVADSNDRIGSK